MTLKPDDYRLPHPVFLFSFTAKIFMRFFLAISIALFTLACSPQKESSGYMDSIKKERKEKNKEFSNKDKSPLEQKDIASFVGLNYFSIDSNYKVRAEYIKVDTATPFQMMTSTDRLPTYVKRGIVKFSIEAKELSLSVYQNLDDEDDFWFIPFSDLTSGETTYGGGRYLDFDQEQDFNNIFLDFNLSYNPYCAYNHKYSCPIPPAENDLSVAIKAGEKVFKAY